MSHHPFNRPLQSARPLGLLLVLAACMAPLTASAATGSEQAERRAIYERDRAACDTGRSTQERSLCLHDVTVAFRMPHTNKPYDLDPSTYARNQVLRCGPLKDKDLEACTARMRGAGSTSGSVQTGGIYRELTTIEVGPEPRALETDSKPAPKASDKQ